MRLKALLFLALAPALVGAQVWEKVVAPGLTYRMTYKPEIPLVIHGLKFNPKSEEVQALPELAGGSVYEDNVTKGRETISALVQRTGAIAAINADYFPFTGDPLGLMVREKELLSRPWPNRSSFAWGKRSAFAIPSFSGGMEDANGNRVMIDGINEECVSGKVVLNTPRAGLVMARSPNIHVFIKVLAGNLEATGRIKGEVASLVTDSSFVTMYPGQLTLVASGNRCSEVSMLRQGDKVELAVTVGGFNWKEVDNAIGGGPFLVRGGATFVDAVEQGFKPDFYKRRHPRTAVGRTEKGDIWFVAVDGRQSMSAGVTLSEMSGVMIDLGCTDAINLDGGGSTALNIFGMLLNRPSEGSERPVANAVAFYGPTPEVSEAVFTLNSPPAAYAGEIKGLTITGEDGTEILQSEIFWRSSGSGGWVDQGGLVRFLAEGEVLVEALVRGRVLSARIAVLPKPMP